MSNLTYLSKYPTGLNFGHKSTSISTETVDVAANTTMLVENKQKYKPKKLVFSGRADDVFINLGIVKSLEENNLLKYLDETCGFSVGSMIALLTALKYSYQEMEEIMTKFDGDILTDSLRFGKPELAYDFYKTRGLYSGNNFSNWIEDIIERKTGIRGATFRDLNKKTGIILHIPLTNLNNSQLEVFNYKLHPDVCVSAVVKSACSLGLLYPPLNVDSMDHTDPIISTTYNISMWDQVNDIDQSVLGVLPLCSTEQSLDSHITQPTNTIYNFLIAILSTLVKSRLGVAAGDGFWDRTIVVNHEGGFTSGIYSLIQEQITADDRNRLIDIGYRAANQYLQDK